LAAIDLRTATRPRTSLSPHREQILSSIEIPPRIDYIPIK
jgi:hypothetical protein